MSLDTLFNAFTWWSRRREQEWCKQHFQELQSSEWKRIATLVRSSPTKPAIISSGKLSTSTATLATSTLTVDQRLEPWIEWCENESMTIVPIEKLLATGQVGQPLAAFVYDLACVDAPSNKRSEWIKAFTKKDPDLQLLVWLHLLLRKSTHYSPTSPFSEFDWNIVTVIQQSSLPFALRVRFTIRTYRDQPIRYNDSISSDEKESFVKVEEKKESSEAAVQSNQSNHSIPTVLLDSIYAKLSLPIQEDWKRVVWESSILPSTGPKMQALLSTWLNQETISFKPPPAVKEMGPTLVRIDRQLDPVPYHNSEQVFQRMMHLTRLVLRGIFDFQPSTVASIFDRISKLNQSKNNVPSNNSPKLLLVSHILHLQSLLTAAQIRRCLLCFWQAHVVFYTL